MSQGSLLHFIAANTTASLEGLFHVNIPYGFWGEVVEVTDMHI